MDDEMRRFEMELAGISQPQYGPAAGPSGGFQSAPAFSHGPSVGSAPVRFIPHQLMSRGPPPGTSMPSTSKQQPRPPVTSYTVHASPQPAQPNFAFPTGLSPIFQAQMAAMPMFPRMTMAPPITTTRPVVQPNVLQVSANKAMLDAQKAMAMQTKEPPVMGPQVTPKSIEDKALSNKAKKKIKYVRTAGGEVWEDTSLAEWDPNDYRIFCGDLGNEVNDEALARAFRKYPTFQKAKIIRDKKSNKSKGYGFVSFKDPNDFVRAMKEMNGKYVGNRPIKLRKSSWKDRQLDVSRKRVKEKQKLGLRA